MIIADETFPTGFHMADPVHPAFDLGGYLSGMATEEVAKQWVSSSDDRWIEWEEVTGERLEEALADFGGREKMEKLLTSMMDERVKTVDPDELIGQTEFAEILGWDRRKVATYYYRGILPNPVKVLASGPIWLREQAENFKKQEELK